MPPTGVGRSGGSGTRRRNRRRALAIAAISLAVAYLFLQVRLLTFLAPLRAGTSFGGPPPRPRDTCVAVAVATNSSSRRRATPRGGPWAPADKNATRRVFGCGWSNAHHLARSVFPEFDGVRPWTAGSASSSYDLLLFGLHGPCEDEQPGRVTNFRGKTLYDNGEPFGDPRDGGPCEYLLGPAADSGTSMRVPFVTLLLMGEFRHRAGRIFDPARRPKNTGERYMLYMASNCVPFRDDAALAFSKVGRDPLHLGGNCPHDRDSVEWIDAEEAPGSTNADGWAWAENFHIYRPYRFALVLENRKMDGYVTEKILNAFLGGSVPVWGGTTQIFDMFNRDAFVYYDPERPDDAVDLVRRLERNRTMYEEMLSKPILANGNKTIEKYFSFEDGVGGGRLKGRIRRMMGLDLKEQ